MLQSRIGHRLILTLALISAVCARGDRVTTSATAAFVEPEFTVQAQSPATTIQSFTTIDGADLKTRLEAASQRARGAQTPYWSAYAFDVRSGVAVDPNIHEFHGSMNTI